MVRICIWSRKHTTPTVFLTSLSFFSSFALCSICLTTRPPMLQRVGQKLHQKSVPHTSEYYSCFQVYHHISDQHEIWKIYTKKRGQDRIKTKFLYDEDLLSMILLQSFQPCNNWWKAHIWWKSCCFHNPKSIKIQLLWHAFFYNILNKQDKETQSHWISQLPQYYTLK